MTVLQTAGPGGASELLDRVIPHDRFVEKPPRST
jgi:hypothetical protein